MAELGENIAAMQKALDKKEKCDYKPDDTTWKCNLEGSSTALAGFLIASGKPKPHAAREADLSSSAWPSQAHHLIPHIQLADHPVRHWLKQGEKIFAHTKYNVDHQHNGVWLPYASGLAEWARIGKVKKRALMFKVMELSGLQLHQGRHSASNTYGVGLAPYKGRVNEYLSKIAGAASSHYKGPNKCEDCNDGKKANKVPPRDNTVRQVDAASKLLLDDIKDETVFVSRISAEFAESVGFD
jgi:hypothetical protein